MAEEAQALVVTNSAQPLVAIIAPARSFDVARTVTAIQPATQAVSIRPASD